MRITSPLNRTLLLTAVTLLLAPFAHAQSKPKAKDVDPEGTRIVVPDVLEDKAPELAPANAILIPDWNEGNARALLTATSAAAAEGLFPADYAPEKLTDAIAGGKGAALNQVATETFLLFATHLRDGRTPNAARKQWFMTDHDADTTPLVELMVTALSGNNIGGALAGLNPAHSNFAVLKAALATSKDKAVTNRIRVNMERWRWMPRDLGEKYVVTNVPEYMTRVVHTGKTIAAHKAVVGKVATATPQLNPLATGIIINPTWTLPRSIINEGIGATIASRPAVARAQGYTWTGKGKTLSVVQSPGPGNALGMMKLEMLNEHAIYLHDTPSKGAFAAADRAFSHGCVRTERALHFSGLMAVMFGGRSPEEFGEAYASGETTRFAFDTPFPVYVAYWTVAPNGDGKLTTFKDLYGRDAPVIASFAQPGRPSATVLAKAEPQITVPSVPVVGR
jgi:murein L,D-transpeptidase YcbB/YkuD